MNGVTQLRRACAGVAVVVVACGACAGSDAPEASTTSSPAAVSSSAGAAETTVGSPAEGFGDHQEVAGYTITRVAAPQGAALPDGVGDVAAYDITTADGAPVARYLRITPTGGAAANDATVQSLLADLAAAHGGGTAVQSTVAGLASWEVASADGTVGVARVSEDGLVVVFLGTDRGGVEAMIAAISAALDTPG